jgi:hypothetical protein
MPPGRSFVVCGESLIEVCGEMFDFLRVFSLDIFIRVGNGLCAYPFLSGSPSQEYED